jgi:ATP-dependent Lhr-like helicase
MPECSVLATLNPQSFGVLYVSPLKALINDQYRRLQSLCERLGLPVTPWHGDVLQSLKEKSKQKPRGILLITPESLESLLINNPAWSMAAFSQLLYVIVDEFHTFLDSERGCQLSSLLHRIEFLVRQKIPRIALSATFSEEEKVSRFLRPDGSMPCKIIISNTFRSDLKAQVRGYIDPIDEKGIPAFDKIADELYAVLRGGSHLVFANSREKTEEYAVALSDRCAKNGVPNEFFPHHGNLSKDLRESLEARLQKGDFPTTAVCTSTLELGIDIGSVDSIAQVAVPHSVSSLRQRLGRSGRRGTPQF